MAKAAPGDSYFQIENIFGSNSNDVLVGENSANVLAGGDGNDILPGGQAATAFQSCASVTAADFLIF